MKARTWIGRALLLGGAACVLHPWPGGLLGSAMVEQFNPPFKHVILEDHFPPDQQYHGDCKGIGDIDGDGFADVIFAGNTLAWYAYPDWKRVEIAKAKNEFTTDMQIGDVDGDGDLDIIVPDGPTGEVMWFENPRPRRDPAKAPWKRHIVGAHGTWGHDLEIGDVNGDGRLDIVTRKGETILWLQRNPDSFQRIVIPTATPDGEGLALADLNRDGRLDILQNGYWLESPPDPAAGNWTQHVIAEQMPRQIAVTAADINSDGRLDVLFGPAETAGRLAWYEAPENPVQGSWEEHVIDPDVDHVHTFKVADVNNDGVLDIVTAEMHQSPRKRVSVYYHAGKEWKRQAIADTGSHNVRIGDIGNDGDIDIVGANWGGDYHPLELWENELIDRQSLPLEKGWRHDTVDDRRAKWGDFAPPPWLRYLGLAVGDANGDRLQDIASGRYFYRNPGKRASGLWPRIDLGVNIDAVLLVDVDGDGRNDIIAEALPDVYWLKPADRAATRWEKMRIGEVPPTEHINSQGYLVAQIFAGGKPEIVLSGGDGIYCFEIPADPRQGAWPRTRITSGTSEEGIAAADFDGDGRLDILASDLDGRTIAWWKNPSHPQELWEKQVIGHTVEWADRIAAADLNKDGRLDAIVTEETPYSGASVYWFEQPAPGQAGEWKRHTVTTQYTTNSLDAIDFDRDGDVDLITCEHRGARRLTFWENRNGGESWVEHVLDTGREGHLGARVADLDGDGRYEIINIAWDTYPLLHLWRKER